MQVLAYQGTLTYRSLGFYCTRFGVEVEDAVTRADIGALVAAGEWSQVHDHVRADVAKTTALARRIGVCKIKNPEPETLRGLSRLYGVGYEEVVGNYAQEKFGVRRSLPGPESEVKDFTTIPLLQSPISRGRALVLELDPKHDGSLAFREDFVKLLTRPVVLRVGKKDAAMTPTIEPGDVVLIDQNLARRRRPTDGQIYALNTGPLTGQDGGTLQRVELKGRTLILSADHPDKSAYPTRTFEVKAATLPEVLVGQVVWVGRTLGTRA